MKVDVRSRENNYAHRTGEIDRKRLIVRRGQPFTITLQHSLPPKHQLELVLHLGKRDEVVIKLRRKEGPGDKWWFNQQRAQGEILLTLHSPADAIIGQYRLAVVMMSPEGRILERAEEVGFHLLFNPWCKDDAVHFPDERFLQEYVMNEYGLIFMGSWNNIKRIGWNYGQFEDNVMDICFQILDNSQAALKNSEMDIEHRSDPVYVGRIITAMLNSYSDRGVLAGQWQEPYTDGVSPFKWTGSVSILRQWSKSRLKPVKYGQCWVFAAVGCTVLRCLGIPTRHITNFLSVHDADNNLCYDYLMDERLQKIAGEDSEWNFHCWVESWMRRDDLPTGYDGWQVLDPTPQELSDGEARCGPCPVKAIKEGHLEVKYDARFIFAEVNADVIYWMVKQDGRRQKIKEDCSSVGRNISTKSAYGNYRQDVTEHYKYAEGSAMEREVYRRAGRQARHQATFRCATSAIRIAEPAQVQLSIKHEQPVFGSDFDVIVEVKNEGSTDVDGQLTILATAVTYNSRHLGECRRQTVSVTVPAHKAHKEVLRLHYDDYAAFIFDQHLIRIKALLETPGENEPIMSVDNISLTVPELNVEVRGRAVVQQPLTVYASLTNPLSVPLKEGVFTFEGAGLLPATEVHADGDIASGQEVSVQLTFYPTRPGERMLTVDFESDRLNHAKGVATVVVRKR